MKRYLLKRNRIKEKNLKYDFLPPMLEVIEKPSNPVGSILILAIFCLLITTIVWASFCKLDVVVTAAGAVTPKEDLVVVQAADSGVVESIRVQDGDSIKQGELLIELEKDTSLWNLEELKYQKELLETQKEIYEKLYADEDINEINPEAYGEFSLVVSGMIEEQKLYLSQEKEYKLQVRLSEEKELAQATLQSYQTRRKMEILQNISNLNVQLEEGNNRLKQAQESLEHKCITAPETGTLSQLQVNHPGEVISASKTIGYIIPEDAVMVFQCYIKNSDIAQIELGQTVDIKLEAYPYSKYGTIRGEIIYIEKLAVSVEGLGAVYPVLISLEEKEGIDYRVGLSGSCDIHVSDRTVLEYFLEPIRKGFRESLHET